MEDNIYRMIKEFSSSSRKIPQVENILLGYKYRDPETN